MDRDLNKDVSIVTGISASMNTHIDTHILTETYATERLKELNNTN